MTLTTFRSHGLLCVWINFDVDSNTKRVNTQICSVKFIVWSLFSFVSNSYVKIFKQKKETFGADALQMMLCSTFFPLFNDSHSVDE